MTETEVDPHEGWTPIVLQGDRQGIPLDVVTTLTNLIGAAYPGAVIDGSGKHIYGYPDKGFVFLVDPATRQKVSKKNIKKAKAHADPDCEPTATGMTADDDGIVLHTVPPEELARELGGIAHVIFTNMAGDNYIEWEVRAKDENEQLQFYVLSIARRKKQTPHALRMKAEEALEEAEDELGEFRLALWNISQAWEGGDLASAVQEAMVLLPENYEPPKED